MGADLTVTDAIHTLDQAVPDPTQGLPDEVFLYISRTTPMINVDLLIQDENGRTLLAWRDEEYTGVGWHVPGGIIRFKEQIETRIEKVALSEIGAEVSFNPVPIAINQLINPYQDIRGHFISILYRCFLKSSFTPRNDGLNEQDNGFLAWHTSCPEALLKFHEIYRDVIGGVRTR